MKINNTPVFVSLSEVVDDRNENIRDFGDDAYDLEPLLADMEQNGQTDPVLLQKKDGKLMNIRGYRRTGAIRLAVTRGLTIKDSVSGKTLVEPGMADPKIKALVYENLTELDVVNLMVDHGQRKGLNKAGLQRAIERLLAVGKTEKEVAVTLWSQLQEHYPLTRKVEDTPEAKLAYYRGVIQTAKRVMYSPTVLHDAVMEKLRGHQAWPTKGAVDDLANIHDKEAKADPTITKSNPGPKFTEAWARVLKAVEEAKINGTNKPKSVSMRNRAQTEDARKNSESFIVKSIIGIQLGEISADNFPVVDKIAQEVEKLLTEDQKSALIAILKSGVAPAAEDKKGEETPAE